MKVLVAGNCQARGIHHSLYYLAPGAEVDCVFDLSSKDDGSLRDRANRVDVVFCQAREADYFRRLIGDGKPRVISYPLIWFDGFHPDMTYVLTRKGQAVVTPTGEYSSALIFFAYKNNLTLSDAEALFNSATFGTLEYYHRYGRAKEQLLSNFGSVGFSEKAAAEVIYASGECPMLTFNHPRLKILYEIATELLRKVEIKPHLPQGKNYLVDHYLKAAVWGVYPEIAANHRMEGGYFFKSSIGQAEAILDLKEYIAGSYHAFRQHEEADLSCPALDNPGFDRLLGAGPAKGRSQIGYFAQPLRPREHDASLSSPYDNAADFQYWRRELRADHPAAIDLKSRSDFQLDRSSRIATFGSCFAQEITRHLRALGCPIMDVEPAPSSITKSQALARGYGVYSARYGNVYTARQMYQLVARATGVFNPEAHVWQRSDGKYVDPFRPLVFRDGFRSPIAANQSRARHLAAVAKLFRELDVCIFTLGLTETWCSRQDSSVFPIAPGVLGGAYDPAIHEYKNFMPSEIVSDLLRTSDLMKTLNPRARILLTVSPVPIIATYEPRSAIVSNCFTKSALRAAAEEASSLRDNIHYFPSFELVSGHHLGAHFYDNEFRGISPAGIERVARAFIDQYFGPLFVTASGPMPWQTEQIGVACDEAALENIFISDEMGSGALQ